jgi:DNA adenine methylase
MGKEFGVLRWRGGKYHMRKKLCGIFGAPRKFFDPFCGGVGYLMHKPVSPIEAFNDLDSDLINFYEVVRDQPVTLINILDSFNYSRESFDSAENYKTDSSHLWRAAKYFIRNRMSRDGDMQSYTFSDRVRRGLPEMQSSFESSVARLESFSARIAHCSFLNNNAFELLDFVGADPDVLIYLDPPYLHETRVAKKLYKHEMSTQDHIKLLTLANQARARVVISGYASRLYNDMLGGWSQTLLPTKICMGSGNSKSDRLEVIWYNR